MSSIEMIFDRSETSYTCMCVCVCVSFIQAYLLSFVRKKLQVL